LTYIYLIINVYRHRIAETQGPLNYFVNGWHSYPDLVPNRNFQQKDNLMRSRAQTDAARRNGAKSNGPKTPEGKAISSANSLRHGMTAKAILLTNENPEAYPNSPKPITRNSSPPTTSNATWSMKWSSPNGASAATGPTRPPCSTSKWTVRPKRGQPIPENRPRYALAFRALADESKSIQLLTRYEAAYHRSYYNALTTLLQLRAQLKPSPESEPSNEPERTEPVENNLYETNVRPNGADYQWVKVPLQELSICLDS